MKNHRFPWLRNRTTDNRKCEKARNIKEKRTIEMFNTVLYPHGAGEVTACRVYGGENIEDGDMEVGFSDGRTYSFQEAVMRNDHKGGEVS